MRFADFCRDTGKVLLVAEDMIHVDADRPFRVVIDAILRHIVAGLLRQRGYVPEHRRQLIREASEIPFQHRVFLFIPAKAREDGFISRGVQTGVESGGLILYVEILRRLFRLPFFLVVNKLLLEYRVNISL